MSCSPGVLSPGLRVVSPDWESFRQIESPHLYLCLWVPFLERGIFTHLFGLFISVILIITSIRWISWTCRDYIYSENQEKKIYFQSSGETTSYFWRINSQPWRNDSGRTGQRAKTTWFIRPTWQSMVFQARGGGGTAIYGLYRYVPLWRI